jgi:hypothetical protein
MHGQTSLILPSDAVALLLACTLPGANLLAVNVNINSTYSAYAASAIVNHYGHSSVPIGIGRPYTNSTFFDTWSYELGEYPSKVGYHWSGGFLHWGEVDKAWDPVKLYRKTLAEAKDDCVTIVSLGFFDHLSGLLNSTGDAFSPLTGRELIEAKVKDLVVMGGDYPSGSEFNFNSNSPQLTAHVINTWPDSVPATFLGATTGSAVLSGADLMINGPSGDPVKAGFEWYSGWNKSQPSWDSLALVYAVRGLGDWFGYGNDDGYNYVFDNGSNIWVEDEIRTSQKYLTLAVSNETVGAGLDALLLDGARRYANGTRVQQ